jgi:hypothetical protein
VTEPTPHVGGSSVTRAEPTDVVGRVSRRLTRGLVAANVVGALVAYVYLQFLAPGAFSPGGGLGNGSVSLVVLVVYLGGAIVVSLRLIRPRTRVPRGRPRGARRRRRTANPPWGFLVGSCR